MLNRTHSEAGKDKMQILQREQLADVIERALDILKMLRNLTQFSVVGLCVDGIQNFSYYDHLKALKLFYVRG